MSKAVKNSILFIMVLIFTVIASASGYISLGGEIPWPLSNQSVVTVANSQGLWKLENKDISRLFNVEMTRDKEGESDWIRVSELNPKTYQVISWGEGLFKLGPKPLKSQSSFWNLAVEGVGDEKDRYGRYLTMFPNGDISQPPYLLRMVEVKTALGRVLGLSVIDTNKKSLEHFLGTRILSLPLDCIQVANKVELNCYLDLP